jgi:hypothetical protein
LGAGADERPQSEVRKLFVVGPDKLRNRNDSLKVLIMLRFVI